jgi:hypothetical protein
MARLDEHVHEDLISSLGPLPSRKRPVPLQSYRIKYWVIRACGHSNLLGNSEDWNIMLADFERLEILKRHNSWEISPNQR